MKIRLDQAITKRKMVSSRSQAESYIRMGKVSVNGKVITKPGFFVSSDTRIDLGVEEQFVNRAALKLKSVAQKMHLDFQGKTVLDVGSSTGGFSEFALSRDAKKVVAVDVGTDQLHPKLRQNPKIELHEKRDIRDFVSTEKFDLILIDVSFISLREILPYIAKNLASKKTLIVAMLKPQFEVGQKLKNAGVVKNKTERRRIISNFESWIKEYFVIENKADSEVAGSRGNLERFYVLRKVKH